MTEQRTPSGVDRIAAVARDPSTLFVYWELTGPALPALKEQLGPALANSVTWTLRVTALETNATSDYPIDLTDHNWYVSVLPGQRYQAQIGAKEPFGTFHPLLTANHVLQPPLSFKQLPEDALALLDAELLALLTDGWGGSSHLENAAGEDEAPWVTVVHDDADAPTSPGVPRYTSRE